MVLVLDGVLLVLLVLFALGGARRGPWPEVVTLGGLLLGALLADEWGDVWSGDLGGTGAARLIVRTLLFLVPLIAVGYGGALLLPKAGRLGVRVRVIGALLGLFNGAAIFAVLLRNWYYTQGTGATGLLDDPGTGFLLNWAGWWPVLLALGGILAVTGAVLTRRRTITTPVSPAPVPAYGAPNGASGASSGATTPALPAATPASSSALPIGATTGGSAPPLTGKPAPSPIPYTNDPAPAGSAPAKADGAGEERRCRTCNHLLAPGAAFCPNCGTPV